MRRLSIRQARRMALAAQGFTDPRPKGRVDARHFRRVFDRIGVLQLDSVNVVSRSHYLPMFARLGPYDRERLDRYTTASGEIFEYWAHMASLVPVARYRLFRWRMAGVKPGQRSGALMAEHPGYIDAVHDEIAARGPMTVSGLSDPGARTGPWWGYGMGKTALEWLFATGRISGYRTKNFTRVYDLTERVIAPKALNAPALSREDAYKELLLLAARHHGVGTARDLSDYYRLNISQARPILDQLTRSGLLDRAEVEGWDQTAYVHPEARTPRTVAAAALLSPFDPVVWERERAERLFGFRYRIEIYVPEPKRVHGYYVLPFLLDDELVARVDLKAHRAEGRLEVRAAHIEDGHDRRRVSRRLAPEIAALAKWLGQSTVSVARRGELASELARAIS